MRRLPALILRDAADASQKIMTIPVSEVALGTVARRRATEDALTTFGARRIDSFTDKGGRRWRIDVPCENDGLNRRTQRPTFRLLPHPHHHERRAHAGRQTRVHVLEMRTVGGVRFLSPTGAALGGCDGIKNLFY